MVDLSTGAVIDEHNLVTYESLGQIRGVTLRYDSTWADPRQVVHFGYDDVNPNIFSTPSALKLVGRLSVTVNGVERVVPGFANAGQFGLRGGEHFWSISAGGGPLDAALQVDLRDQPTGLYPYRLATGLEGFTGSRFIGSLATSRDQLIHVNSIASPFGSGWNIAGLQQLVVGPDGSVLIVDGDGTTRLFRQTAIAPRDLLVTSANTDSILRFDELAGDFIDDFVQSGSGGLDGPSETVFGADGNLYVTSSKTDQILRYNGTTGAFIDVFVSAGSGGLDSPADLKFGPDGNLYVTSFTQRKVLRYNGQTGAFIDTFINSTNFTFNRLLGMQFGPDGNVYLADTNTTNDGHIIRFDGATGAFLGEFVSAANLGAIGDLEFGPDGDLYIPDFNSSQVKRFDGTSGAFLGVFASGGGIALADGLTFGPDGNIYVTAQQQGAVYRYNGVTGAFIDKFVSNGSGGLSFAIWGGTFMPGTSGVTAGGFIPPPGDFSTLEQLADGTFRRTTKDQMAYQFDAQNRLSTVTDRNGNTTRYDYDAGGNLMNITDPVGLETAFAYSGGRANSITDPAGRVTMLQYDAMGNLIRAIDPDGTSRNWEYDADHHLTASTDKRGNRSQDSYDQFGRAMQAIRADGSIITVAPGQVQGLFPPTATTNPANAPAGIRHPFGDDARYADGNGNVTRTRLDVAGQKISSTDSIGALPIVDRNDQNLVTTSTDARGNDTFFTYDDRGNLTTIQDEISMPLGVFRTLTYDPTFSQLTSDTDELGHRTLYDIDPANGNVRSMTEVVGQVDSVMNGETDDVMTKITYTLLGQIDTVTDPLGRVADFDYDPIGRLTQVTLADGTADQGVRSFEYDAAGNRTAMIDENGHRTEYEYDSLNRLTRVVEADPDGAGGPLTSPVTVLVYDPAGNLIRVTDARGNVTRYEYDSLDRQTKMIDPNSGEMRFAYDANDNLTSFIDELGHVTEYRYDARDRLIETIDPDDGSTRFEYDLDDNLTALIDPVGNRTQFAYDARSRLTRETQASLPAAMNFRTFEYDAADNLVRTTDRNNRVSQFAYDDLDRLITETWVGGGNAIQYGYDKSSNLLAAMDGFSSLAFAYDARNRIISVDNAGTPNVPNVLLTYSYDARGNLLSMADSIGGMSAGLNSYAYDALDRMTQVTQSGTGVAPKRIDFTYNPLGQFASINRFSDLAATQPVVHSTFEYDAMNRLTAITHSNPANPMPLAFFNFTFDAASRITSIADVDGLSSYSYDDRDQLTGADHAAAGNPDESYTYDANGNRVSSSLHGTGYVTGPNNRLLSDGTFNYSYDDEGNLVLQTTIATSARREFQWDFRNRLTAVIDKDPMGIETQRVEFTYDALNRRISKNVTTSGGTTLTHFVHDGFDVLFDFVDPDGSGPQPSTLNSRLLHGPAIDQVLAQEDSAGTVLWHLTDHLGTVHDLVNSAGAVANHIVYDSFGNVVSQSDGTKKTRYRFTGREFDSELGVHFYRARYYDSIIGRFLSEDPIGFGGSQANLYALADNKPTSRRDPSGLDSTSQPQQSFDIGPVTLPERGQGRRQRDTDKADRLLDKPSLSDKDLQFLEDLLRANGQQRFAENLDRFLQTSCPREKGKRRLSDEVKDKIRRRLAQKSPLAAAAIGATLNNDRQMHRTQSDMSKFANVLNYLNSPANASP